MPYILVKARTDDDGIVRYSTHKEAISAANTANESDEYLTETQWVPMADLSGEDN